MNIAQGKAASAATLGNVATHDLGACETRDRGLSAAEPPPRDDFAVVIHAVNDVVKRSIGVGGKNRLRDWRFQTSGRASPTALSKGKPKEMRDAGRGTRSAEWVKKIR